MRFSYLLYPEALDAIKNNGIAMRVKKLTNSEKFNAGFGGLLSENDIAATVSDMKAKGFYNKMPEAFAAKYKEVMNGIFRDPKGLNWSIIRQEGIVHENCELDDLLLFSADLAATILKPEELWNNLQFGFASPTGFIAAVGTYIMHQSRSPSFREGYKWITTNTNGCEILTQVTGNGNAEMRIYQTDVSPYQTTDPFGNSTLVRPVLSADKHAIAAYHSTEGMMLRAVIKYMDQQRINAGYNFGNAKKIIEWGRSLGQRGGSSEKRHEGLNQNAISAFADFDTPIPQLNDKDETNQQTDYWLGSENGAYAAYMAHNGDLVFSHQSESEMRNPHKQISARFLPKDAEHLVKGLVYQAASGLGRTSANELLNLISYRHTERFSQVKL